MKKEIKVILSQEAREVYQYLNLEAPNSKMERSILKAIHQKISLIKLNPNYGDPISKDKIPKEYKEKYQVTNLFRLELPNFWRMLYTLSEGESKIEIIAFVIDIMNHPDYDKKFGYHSR